MGDRQRGAKGLGSLRRRANGAWVWQLDFGKDAVTGKRDRITRERSTAREAAEAGREVYGERRRRGMAGDNDVAGSIKDWFGRWLDGPESTLRAPRTRARRERHVRRRIVPTLGHVQLSELTEAQVFALFESVESATMRNEVMTTLASGWAAACVDDAGLDETLIVQAFERWDTSPRMLIANATSKAAAEAAFLASLGLPPKS